MIGPAGYAPMGNGPPVALLGGLEMRNKTTAESGRPPTPGVHLFPSDPSAPPVLFPFSFINIPLYINALSDACFAWHSSLLKQCKHSPFLRKGTDK